MRIVLASLMCLLLGTSQSWALKGGPPYPQGSNIVGTYAGVLQGVFDPTNPASSNSIGIFSLGVPSSGNATGAFVMFSRGRVFTGTAQAFANPQKASLKGILSASYTYNLSSLLTNADGTQTVVTTPITATAAGPVNAKISTVGGTVSGGTATSSATVIRGDANLSISQGQVAANGDPVISSILSLVVSGVKQSSSVTAAPAVVPTTGG